MKTQEREREREVTLEYDWMKILKVRGERTRISYFLLMNGRGKEYIYVCTCGLRGARHVIQYKPRMFGFNFNHACNIINSNILPKKKKKNHRLFIIGIIIRELTSILFIEREEM